LKRSNPGPIILACVSTVVRIIARIWQTSMMRIMLSPPPVWNSFEEYCPVWRNFWGKKGKLGRQCAALVPRNVALLHQRNSMKIWDQEGYCRLYGLSPAPELIMVLVTGHLVWTSLIVNGKQNA
jgi:hypothetical protein